MRWRRGGYALVGVVAGLLSLSSVVNPARAAPEPGVCSGVLTTSGDRFAIVEEPEHICIFSGEDKKKIFASCTEGHYCEVVGILDDCKDSGECSELTSVAAVRDVTLAQQQEQPPPPEARIPSVPAEIARLPAELRTRFEFVERTCGSAVKILDGFVGYLADHNDRFIVLHFENIRCDDLSAICKTRGCLHQIYRSKDNQPYELGVSAYVTEVELKHLNGTVGAEITSSDGKRVLRWDGGGFH